MGIVKQMNWYEVVYFNEAQPEFAIYFIHFDATYLACITLIPQSGLLKKIASP